MRGLSLGSRRTTDILRACRRDDTGAAAVEFALVALLLFSLLIGIIEITLLLRDNVSVSSAVRTGARIASAQPAAGSCVLPKVVTDPPCVPNKVPALAQNAAGAIQKAGLAMPQDAIDEIWVYKANDLGLPFGATSLATATCSTDCVVMKWNAANGQFEYSSGQWDSSRINACIPISSAAPPTDSVGVVMKATHRFLFGLFGTTLSMQDRAVMQFEPLPQESCAPGQHQ